MCHPYMVGSNLVLKLLNTVIVLLECLTRQFRSLLKGHKVMYSIRVDFDKF